jgi:two-component system OmpR family sensor kinase
VGGRIQARRGDDESRVVLRLAGSYLAVFLVVIGALSALAFALIAANFRGTLGPALETPEGSAAFGASLRSVAGSILALDAALALAVGAASFWLARAAVRPLVDAREREARFAADAAHELRTPLGIISSVAQVARDDPGRASAALGTIGEHALDASALIADLLTLARNPELRNLAREPVDLEALTVRQVRSHEPAAATAGIHLQLRSQSAIVDGDERRLNQLLRNLLDNALRYATSSVVVVVRVAGQRAIVEVDDDGPGVAPEIADRLFERFAKEAGSDGSGLGLAICRWVARSHGGDVTHEGASHFIVSLPLGNYPDLERVP